MSISQEIVDAGLTGEKGDGDEGDESIAVQGVPASENGVSLANEVDHAGESAGAEGIDAGLYSHSI